MIKAKLFSFTQPSKVVLEETQARTAQDLIAYYARVSNPSNQDNTATSEKLIRYLIKHKHWSPFEMINAVMEIDVPRDIGRQLLRHRSLSFQEFSQRYADPTRELEFTAREARLQDPVNRQNSIQLDLVNDFAARDLSKEWHRIQQEVISTSRKAYEWAVSNGIAKEQARAVLPEGLTQSRLYANGTIRSWIHYIELRTEHGTQLEHRQLAGAIAQELISIFPLIKDFNKYQQ